MNTTTELAQRMKAAAIDAKDLGNIARYSKGYEAIKAFSALMTPDNVLALVEALEAKEEQRANWFQMAEKLGHELDVAEKRIAVLEGMNAASAKYGMKVANSRDKLRNRVSELNRRRTLIIPETFHPDGDIDAPLSVTVDDLKKACAAAGVAVEGE
ncbi:ead/Ea22-like family protein [Escherichia coli]|nr:ead/Ea22-like family protein [Escherichia coli]MDY8958415.1 ead/Ea22-like family protein [Escherichia coli]MDY8997129.1 ead/Ea22-like family protein [Escherichia coli]MDY9034222.1 ead/Ea22-like family protein [Escherichia coli]